MCHLEKMRMMNGESMGIMAEEPLILGSSVAPAAEDEHRYAGCTHPRQNGENAVREKTPEPQREVQ